MKNIFVTFSLIAAAFAFSAQANEIVTSCKQVSLDGYYAAWLPWGDDNRLTLLGDFRIEPLAAENQLRVMSRGSAYPTYWQLSEKKDAAGAIHCYYAPIAEPERDTECFFAETYNNGLNVKITCAAKDGTITNSELRRR